MLLAGIGLAVVGVIGFTQSDRFMHHLIDLFGRPTRAQVDQVVWEAAALRLVCGLIASAGIALMVVSLIG